MINPVNRHFNFEDDTSTLYFEDREPGDFFIRGGICWPEMVEIHGDVEVVGYAVICGKEIKTDTVYVFDQFQFLTIENIIDKATGVMQYPGIAQWLCKNWANYFAQQYFWCQPEELARAYRLEIIRSKMIKPQPFFKEVPWSDDNQATIELTRVMTMGKLKMDPKSKLFEQIAQVKKADDKLLPAVHALKCALIGYQRYPYYKKAASERP